MSQVNWSFFAGQSLAVGLQSTPPLSVDPLVSSWTKKIDTDGSLASLINEVSGQQPVRTAGPTAEVSGRMQAWNTHALGGATYAQLKKGTTTYNEAIARATAGYNYAVAHGNTFVTDSMHIVHGEANSGGTSKATYAGYLTEWLSDFNTDIKAITGQSRNMVALVCQLSATDEVGWGQLLASQTNANIYLVCPKYQLPKIDGLHLTNQGSWWLGEYHGRVHKKVVVDGVAWKPVSPRSITQVSSRKIQVRFHVPTPPLQFSTIHMATQSQYGFTYLDDASSPSNLNVSVAIISSDTVEITVPRDIAGNPRISYGTGNLCDSDPYVSTYDGTPLPNWAVKFREYVGFSYDPGTTTPPSTSTILDTNGNPVVEWQKVNGVAVALTDHTRTTP